MKKSLSLALSCAIVFLSPGLGCWRALAAGDVEAGVRMDSKPEGTPIAIQGMSLTPLDSKISGDALGVDAIDSIGETEINAEQSRILPLIDSKDSHAKPAAAMQASPLAKNIAAPLRRINAALAKKIKKMSQIFSNARDASQELFDGMFLQQNYAMAIPTGNMTKGRNSSVLHMATMDESNATQSEPATPSNTDTNAQTNDNSSAPKTSLDTPPTDGNQPPAPKKDLSWSKFFAGIGGAGVEAIVAAISATPLALAYGPQAYWYGFQLIWTDKSQGVNLKTGESFLLALAVPIVMAASPIVGLIYGVIAGFRNGSQNGFIATVKDSLRIVKDMRRFLQEAKNGGVAQIGVQKTAPRPTQVNDIPLVVLAKGLSGSVASLIPLPIPAFLSILVQSPRVLYYGFKATWESQKLGLRYKLALSLLFPIAYILINALALPGATLYALGMGFWRGKKADGGATFAFKSGWDDVKQLNRSINDGIAGFQKGEFPDL